jgi:hypothetical protein
LPDWPLLREDSRETEEVEVGEEAEIEAEENEEDEEKDDGEKDEQENDDGDILMLMSSHRSEDF